MKERRKKSGQFRKVRQLSSNRLDDGETRRTPELGRVNGEDHWQRASQARGDIGKKEIWSLELMTVAEVAQLLRMTERGVYSLVEARRIPFVKVSNRLRFEVDEVLRWLQEIRVPTLERDQ